MQQMTIKDKVTFLGLGVHSGKPSSVTVWPAESDTGLVFVSAKKHQQKARIGSIVPEAAMHATVLNIDGWYLSTVEHLVAALVGVGIDNAVLEVDGDEIPILDGSSFLFVQELLDVGCVATGGVRHGYTPKEPINLRDDKGRLLEVWPHQDSTSRDLVIQYSVDFKHPLVGAATFDAVVTRDFFIREIAPARTFGFLDQLPFLRQHNLAQGSALSNTVVIGSEMLNEQRFANECIRHKVLDLIGDVSLLPFPFVGNLRAQHTSHNFNRLLIEHAIRHPEAWVTV